jgi:hypothetical protein
MSNRLHVSRCIFSLLWLVGGTHAGITLRLGQPSATTSTLSSTGPQEIKKAAKIEMAKLLLSETQRCTKMSNEELEKYLRVYFAEQVATDIIHWPEAAIYGIAKPGFLPELTNKIAAVEGIDSYETYETFKKRFSVEDIDSFLLRECSCALARKKSSLRENTEKCALGALAHIPADEPVRIVDIGAGSLLSLLTLINNVAKTGHKTIEVFAIDHAYDYLIQRYQELDESSSVFDIDVVNEDALFLKNYADENGSVVEHDNINAWLTAIGAHLSATCNDEAAKHTDEAAEACDYYQNFLSPVAKNYQLNHMMRAFLRWAHQYGIAITFNVYANVDDYIEDIAAKKTGEADIVTMIDVPLMPKDAKIVLKDFQKVKAQALTPSGRAIFFGRIGKKHTPEEGKDPSQAIFYANANASCTHATIVDVNGKPYKDLDKARADRATSYLELVGPSCKTAICPTG